MKKSYKIYNVIILDESGSMQAIKAFTINGFNQVLETIQKAESENSDQQHFVTFISFNTNGIKTHLFNEPAARLKALNGGSFRPDACTPLYDAMGSVLTRQRESVSGQKNTEVLVTILTDGQENASVEYDFNGIKSLLKELKSLGWTITYMGANHDVEKFSISIGIEHYAKFETNQSSMESNFMNERVSRMAFYSKAGMPDKGAFFQESPDEEEAEKKDEDQEKV